MEPVAEPFALPGPRASAVAAVLALVAGMSAGSALAPTDDVVAAAGTPPPVVVVVPPPAPPVPAPAAQVREAASGRPSATSPPPAVPDPPARTTDATAGAPPAASTPDTEGDADEEDDGAEPADERPAPVEHVWVVVLGPAGFDRAFGPQAASSYLAHELRPRGVLLEQFHAVAHGGLPSGLAFLTGQGPTPQTMEGCRVPADLTPGTTPARGDAYDQARGTGCALPATVQTLPGKVLAAGKTFKAYYEHAADGDACRTPGARHPIAFLHGLADDPSCSTQVAPLSQLAPDVADAGSTPHLSYVVLQPDLLGAEAALRATVDAITASRAFRDDGLLVVVPDEGEHGDFAAPAFERRYPNLTAPTGGGRTGALALSPFIAPGGTVDTPLDQFSLLRTVEDLLALERPHLGYARDPLRTPFGPAVFTATSLQGDGSATSP